MSSWAPIATCENDDNYNIIARNTRIATNLQKRECWRKLATESFPYSFPNNTLLTRCTELHPLPKLTTLNTPITKHYRESVDIRKFRVIRHLPPAAIGFNPAVGGGPTVQYCPWKFRWSGNVTLWLSDADCTSWHSSKSPSHFRLSWNIPDPGFPHASITVKQKRAAMKSMKIVATRRYVDQSNIVFSYSTIIHVQCRLACQAGCYIHSNLDNF